MKKRVAIFGGSGYGGSELLKILLFHPGAEVVFVTAHEHAGKRVSDVHKNLLGLTNLEFQTAPEDLAGLGGIDVAFFALPHGQAMNLVPQLPEGVKAIDLSGDFRIDDPALFEEHYKLKHSATDLQRGFVYGLTETNRGAIRAATYIANPGCFATATLLALAPMVKSGLLTGKVVVDAKTGSSGSGIKPATNTHHPQRANSFYAYKPFAHQHVPEIEQHLRTAGAFESELIFMTHSLPVSRGVFASCYLETKVNLTNEDLRNVFSSFYGDSFFVRLVDGSPDINWVKNTNFCDIGAFSNGKQIVIFSAIDNLVKGAAGQAVQNMNLMFGFEETTGLISAGGNP
ncbi:MAG TPA: N-acetyl-gamma-glutamyl-phosphate reductase [Pyrinomonadaceae bacterium]|nr:N-acetyl-gamma-glutamyl-phosphate reductase [Pyrinomonadaceae bacterium]